MSDNAEQPPAELNLTNAVPDMSAVIADMISDVAEAIEQRIGGRAAIRSNKSEYEASLLIAYDKRLHEAAVAAITVIITNPRLRPNS